MAYLKKRKRRYYTFTLDYQFKPYSFGYGYLRKGSLPTDHATITVPAYSAKRAREILTQLFGEATSKAAQFDYAEEY